MPFNNPRKIIVNLPVVCCCECGNVLNQFAVWCLHRSGVYCVKCAPVGSLVFREV
jgi:hypothetical protein